MNIETFKMLLAMFVMAYIFMGAVFMFYQKRGQPFLTSFDKAAAWAAGFFVVGSSVSALTLMA